MRKGIVGGALVMAIVLGGTFVNWTYQWATSMKSRADHQCTDTKDRLLLVPGNVLNGGPGFEYVSCEELIGKK